MSNKTAGSLFVCDLFAPGTEVLLKDTGEMEYENENVDFVLTALSVMEGSYRNETR
ncbi:hypothetical protein HBHAL_4295 [Halobacillus halophilus DSM 2266]|uniref:Uncharacterized protein n=1 Tax=Halobacillus halophilus (strain ATCC 35676 / DSM 2266 / JCM 20832 / KCTC 3685 / LMG 17431 / NBRC 102448 / NCIMB 2269) TaxID=866895 RepID=I0JR66_HALH3|nr:hypothetical protein [Halobacillus halophilus]CCG46636.1 hypothetical protein HBHAL_4295 [Halobacillus halophilus DSM 2266]